MSYAEAQEAARLEMIGGCTIADLIREILSDAPDEFMQSLADNAECADSLTIKCHEAACLRAGKEVIGLVHKYLADNYPKEWRDGVLHEEDEDHEAEDRLSLGREMAKLSRSLGPRL